MARRGHYDDSIDDFKRSVAARPAHALTRYFLAETLSLRWAAGKDPGKRAADLEESLYTYQELKRYLAANFLQIHQRIGNLYLARADAFRLSGDTRAAGQDYSAAIEALRRQSLIDPVDPYNRQQLAYALAMTGRFEEAKRQLKSGILTPACTVSPTPSVLSLLWRPSAWSGHAHTSALDYVYLANAYLVSGDYSRAVATYRGYLRWIDPASQKMAHNLSVILANKAAIIKKILTTDVFPKAH